MKIITQVDNNTLVMIIKIDLSDYLKNYNNSNITNTNNKTGNSKKISVIMMITQ